MTLHVQKPIRFVNKCGAKFNASMLAKAVLWYANGKPTYGEKPVYLHDSYPAVSVKGKHLHIHRLLISWIEGNWLKRELDVHHKNENKLDARLKNLEIIAAGRHQSAHLKGKPQDKEFVKRRIAASIKKRWPNSTKTLTC